MKENHVPGHGNEEALQGKFGGRFLQELYLVTKMVVTKSY